MFLDNKIRCANINDIVHMLKCYDSGNELYDINKRAKGDLSSFEEIYNSNKVYVIENSLDIIGWISYKIKERSVFITGLYIKKDFHRNGVASQLLDYCFKDFVKEGVVIATLKVLKNAFWAITFYEKNGFVIYDSDTSNNNVILNKYINEIHQNNWSYIMFKLSSI